MSTHQRCQEQGAADVQSDPVRVGGLDTKYKVVFETLAAILLARTQEDLRTRGTAFRDAVHRLFRTQKRLTHCFENSAVMMPEIFGAACELLSSSRRNLNERLCCSTGIDELRRLVIALQEAEANALYVLAHNERPRKPKMSEMSTSPATVSSGSRSLPYPAMRREQDEWEGWWTNTASNGR